MAIGIAKIGKVGMAVETSLGTAGSYHDIRVDSMPQFPPTQELVPNHIAGHANPFTVEKPEKIQKIVEKAFTLDMKLRRAAANGGVPDIIPIFQSAGWNAAQSTGATTLTGTPSVSALAQAANVTAAGRYILVEQSAGLYVPVLTSILNTLSVVPHVQLRAAPSTGAAVHPMYTLTPTTTTAYKVGSDKTLSFRRNTRGMMDDALGDLTPLMKACALASVGEIVIGSVGSEIKLSFTFHGCPVGMTPSDIAVDGFTDSGRFPLVTTDAEFSIVAASASGNIVLVRAAVSELKINLNINTVPVYNSGGADNIGGASDYILIPAPPEITVTAQFNKDAYSKAFQTNLDGSNPSYCIQYLQPTRDLDVPAWAFTAPNCHLMPGGEPKIDADSKNLIEVTAKFVASAGGINSTTLISEEANSPIFFGISGEAAA